jgi:hypothetical protein
MKKTILSLVILAILIFPLKGFAEEPVPHKGFVQITETILNKLDVLNDNARNGNFNQLKNPELQKQFDDLRTVLNEYEKYAPKNFNYWPAGKQKDIASKLYTTNFLYRAYSLSQHNEYRQNAEKSLQKARELFREYTAQQKVQKIFRTYLSHVKTSEMGFIDY